MKALVISDTHMPRRGRQLPVQLLREMEKVDIVFHLGDVTEMEALEPFRSVPTLYGVHGNNDSREVCAYFPARLELTVQEQRLVLIHGHLGGRTGLAAARAERGADIVLFGHSHTPFLGHENGVLLFNPGSPTEKRWGPTKSFGILQFEDVPRATVVPLP